MLIAIEGIDQTGKQTQADLLAEALVERGREVLQVSFPEYGTTLGGEIRAFLHAERDYPPEARHLLFAANRYERRAEIVSRLEAGAIVVADRWCASGIAYGMALGLPRGWLANLDALLPPADVTILLDSDPQRLRARQGGAPDTYERDTAFLARCRTAYLALADTTWLIVDAMLPVATVHARILETVLRAVDAKERGQAKGSSGS